ncbi:MAG: type II toxin-antitoxin system RelE/ParE family toxin [Salinivirgaceae bacterium]|jgi:plasmid stabilization system protein ParE
MVEDKTLPIIWDKVAKTQLRKAYNKIAKESSQGAETVLKGIINCIDELPKQPNRHPADKFKANNTGAYRAFETHNYRITYKITDKNIQILRVRHVKREPLDY